MFPPKKDDGGNSKPPAKKPAAGQQHQLLHPSQRLPQVGVKPGQGMNPMEAMMGGMGDMSMFAPPPPPPLAPLGPGGLPIGGGMPQDDPGFDPKMGGSSLFQALNMSLDPYGSPPSGHGDLDPPPDIHSLLAMLALQQSGLMNPSGQMPDPTVPGIAQGLERPALMY